MLGSVTIIGALCIAGLTPSPIAGFTLSSSLFAAPSSCSFRHCSQLSLLRDGVHLFGSSITDINTGRCVAGVVGRKAPSQFSRPELALKMAVPQYDQHDGKIVYTEALCAGSKLLRVKSSTAPIDYLPGHVFALEVPKDGTEDPPGEGSNKGKHGDGTKGPYTVTRADAAKGTFDVVIRKIKGGRLSQRLASLRKGAPVSFGGKFKVPIAEGRPPFMLAVPPLLPASVSFMPAVLTLTCGGRADVCGGISDAASSICLISTGVGLGPLVGYLEQAENAGEQRPTKVFAGFRALSDVIFEEELEALAEDTDGRVRFQMCVSELRDERYPPPPGYEGLRDRVTRSVPQVLDPAELKTTHFHLIGNGGMVKTFQAALSKAGVPDEHVTIEMYFNHKEEVLDSEVEDMVKALQAPARSSEWVGAET